MKVNLNKLVKKWKSIPEPDMLRQKILDWIEQNEEREVVQQLHNLYYSDLKTDLFFGYFSILYHILDETFLHYELRKELYIHAKEMQYEEIMNILFIPYQEQNKVEAQMPYNRIFDDLTPGERKWKARLHNPYVLERLLHDPNPQVIRILLRNPKLSEESVLKIVTHRPARINSLREVLRSTKWICRYKIVKAIIYNPWSPISFRVGLLPILKKQDKKDIAQSPDFPEIIRKLSGI